MNLKKKEQVREIKFRAWDKKLKKFRFFHLFHSHTIITDLPIPSKGEWEHLEKFEQFTGLKDKNGKDIFEGDIVEFISPISKGKRIVSIDFRNGQYWLIEMGGALTLLNPAQELKVIGNIYENPELLEKK